MKLNTSNKNKLRFKMFNLMDEVQLILEEGVSIDDFLDETDLFSAWEEVIPEKEYPIFVMAVLNNIRKESIIDTILDSLTLENQKKNQTHISRKNKLISHMGELPFN